MAFLGKIQINKAAREVTFTLYKSIKSQAESAKILPKPRSEIGLYHNLNLELSF
jgi:hypothetical protein